MCSHATSTSTMYALSLHDALPIFALPDGPLKITITGVEGMVQQRATPDQKWERVQVGQTFSEGVELRTGDRKSTRLNSSHSQISYAVFCLKKKRTARPVGGLAGAL